MSEINQAQYGGDFHRWACPACEDVNEEESDPRGNTVECADCGWTGTVEA